MTSHVERDEQRCAPRVGALRLLPFAEWCPPGSGPRRWLGRGGTQAVTDRDDLAKSGQEAEADR
jgi:hypothetical protein